MKKNLLEMNAQPIGNDLSIQPTYFPVVNVAQAVAAWHAEFYSNPANRKAYAQWCEAQGLEYDLPEPPGEE